MPGNAIVKYIEDQMGDEHDESDEKWKNFARILIQAITSNTYLFTRLIETGQQQQVDD